MRSLSRLLAAACAAAAIAVPAAASAATLPHAPTAGVVYTTGGEAGYYAHSPGIRMGGLHWQMNLTQQASLVAGPSTVSSTGVPTITGALGGQLCDAATGDAIQFGAFYVPGTAPAAGQWEFAYEAGVLNGTPSNGDPCIGGLLSSGTPTVATYGGSAPRPVTETTGAQVRLSIQTYISPHAGGTGVPGRVVVFSIYDVGTGLVDWTSPPVPLNYLAGGVWPQFHEAGVGIQAVNPAQALPTLTPVVPFSYVRVGDYAGQWRYMYGKWAATEVVTTTDGTSAGTVLVSPQASLAGGHFTVSSATPVVTP